jgi:hypothetical protein
MYAVVTRASIKPGRKDDVVGMTNSMAIPMLKSEAGHVASYFTVSPDGSRGVAISVFESKEQAESSAANVTPPPDGPFDDLAVEVCEVIGSI